MQMQGICCHLLITTLLVAKRLTLISKGANSMILNTTIALLILNSPANGVSNNTVAQPQMVNYTLVMEVVSSIDKLYEFENFVFFVSERLASSVTNTATVFFDDFWDAFPLAPIILIVNSPSQMSGFLSTSTLCLILTTESDDPIMEVAALSMKGTRYIKTIFVLFPVMKSDQLWSSSTEYSLFYRKIRLIYEWVWRKQFLNTLLITIKNNIYIHEPYPTASIVNKTNDWSAKDFFVDYSANFKGYQIQTMWLHDLPRVFRMSRLPLGRKREEISGVSAKMFLAFVEVVNATFNDTLEDKADLEAVQITDVLHMVEDKNLEIGINTYTAMIPTLVGASYPIGINDFCIMVPYQNRSPERIYVQGALSPHSWCLLMFTVFYITIGIWICTPSWERDLSLSFLQSICSLILIVPLRFLTLPFIRLRFLYVILFLMGFFITNMYLSKITSYLSTPTKQKQIDSVEDIIEANLPLMMLDYEYERLKNENFPQKLLNLIFVGTKRAMDGHRDHFNSTFGYSTQTDRWSFLNKQQIYLKKPLFRISSICIGPYYHVFPIQRDSHLAKPLQDFILAAYQYGLNLHWEAQAFLDALFMGYVTIILIELQPIPLTVTYFRPIWFVWWLGMIVAGLSFILEIKGITFSVIKKVVKKAVNWLRIKLN